MVIQHEIQPFIWCEDGQVILDTGDGAILCDVFETRADEGFLGNGYDWTSLAGVYLEEMCQEEVRSAIDFDPEAGMFCVRCDDEEILKEFIVGFKKACNDKKLILDLFSRAELD